MERQQCHDRTTGAAPSPRSALRPRRRSLLSTHLRCWRARQRASGQHSKWMLLSSARFRLGPPLKASSRIGQVAMSEASNLDRARRIRGWSENPQAWESIGWAIYDTSSVEGSLTQLQIFDPLQPPPLVRPETLTPIFPAFVMACVVRSALP